MENFYVPEKPKTKKNRKMEEIKNVRKINELGCRIDVS